VSADVPVVAETAQGLSQLDQRLLSICAELNAEEDKHKRWKEENIRRRHNYVPFVVQLLRILASKGELMPLLEAAKSSTQ